MKRGGVKAIPSPNVPRGRGTCDTNGPSFDTGRDSHYVRSRKEKDKALIWLGTAYESHHQISATVFPTRDSLRLDLRFRDIVRCMNFRSDRLADPVL